MADLNSARQWTRTGLSLLMMFWLAACSGLGEVKPEDTAGAIVAMGMEEKGLRVRELGHYYVFNFINANDEPLSVIKRPKHNQDTIFFTELAPGEWTLDNFVVRAYASVDGFEAVSGHPRYVFLNFPVKAGSIQILSHQLTIVHERLTDDIDVYPKIVPLTDPVREGVERRVAQMGEHWHRISQPVGTLLDKEAPKRPGLFERLFGN